MKALGRRGRRSAAIIVVLAVAVSAPAPANSQVAVNPDVAALAKIPIVDSTSLRAVIGNLAGKSGKLLARFVTPPRPIQIPRLSGNLSYTARALPTIQEVTGASRLGKFSLITMKSFGEKIAGSVGAYRVGFWPEERGRLRSEAYENPEGFIEVTPSNQDTRISEHFRLKDFLTHDQHEVWPKYLVLREPLLDKLELVIQDLEDHGVPARNVQVLSGFRTPQYNQALGAESGRARDSRHQFGDAADIFVDSNHDGRMDDLNNDGRVNFRDTRVILASVERVEARYPDLIGGTGLYHSAGSHGPFAHIDVRGSRARWTTTTRVASRRSARHSKKSTASRKTSKSRKIASD
ncbi:MAG: hypothetical protein ABI556_08060 [Gemmatimonadales bacterium]